MLLRTKARWSYRFQSRELKRFRIQWMARWQKRAPDTPPFRCLLSETGGVTVSTENEGNKNDRRWKWVISAIEMEVSMAKSQDIIYNWLIFSTSFEWRWTMEISWDIRISWKYMGKCGLMSSSHRTWLAGKKSTKNYWRCIAGEIIYTRLILANHGWLPEGKWIYNGFYLIHTGICNQEKEV